MTRDFCRYGSMQLNLIQLPHIALSTNKRGGQDKELANVLALQSCLNSSLNMLVLVCLKLLAPAERLPALSDQQDSQPAVMVRAMT